MIIISTFLIAKLFLSKLAFPGTVTFCSVGARGRDAKKLLIIHPLAKSKSAIQLTPDNSNLQGKSEKVRVIGSSNHRG